MFITKKPKGFLYLVILERNYQICGTNVSLDLLSERSLHQLSMVCVTYYTVQQRKLQCFLQPHSQASLLLVSERNLGMRLCFSQGLVQKPRLLRPTVGGVWILDETYWVGCLTSKMKNAYSWRNLKLKLRGFFTITEQFLVLWLVESVVVN